MSASARRNDVISIAPILVRLSRILHGNGTATAVLAVPVPPPLCNTQKVREWKQVSIKKTCDTKKQGK